MFKWTFSLVDSTDKNIQLLYFFGNVFQINGHWHLQLWQFFLLYAGYILSICVALSAYVGSIFQQCLRKPTRSCAILCISWNLLLFPFKFWISLEELGRKFLGGIPHLMTSAHLKWCFSPNRLKNMFIKMTHFLGTRKACKKKTPKSFWEGSHWKRPSGVASLEGCEVCSFLPKQPSHWMCFNIILASLPNVIWGWTPQTSNSALQPG